jgi:hypothetical protein
MKMNETRVTGTMSKNIYRQLMKSFCLLVAIAAVVLALLAITGQFSIDAHSDDALGVYYSAFKGLPAYYNAGLSTVLVLETVSVILLPIGLLAARRSIKALQEVSVMPWLVVMLAAVLNTAVGFIGIGEANYGPPPILVTILPWFLQTQFVFIAGLVAGYGLLAWRLSKHHGGRA